MFKILSLHSEESEGFVVHTLRLEYGSLKPLEEKVSKSEKLLDAEYFFMLNREIYSYAKNTLEINREKISEEAYEKLAKLLPKAESQLKRRKKFLKEWEETEYLSALEKLSGWEKELIMNTKHQ